MTRLTRDLRMTLVFLTRLPIKLSGEVDPGDLARASWSFPLVGLLVGAFAALLYLLALACGLSTWLAALMGLAGSLLLSGALHEDGLADLADGFGGGWTRERKLEIMRDSRLGTYGAAALFLSLALRGAALASLQDGTTAAAVLLVTHVTARAPLPLFMWSTPLARRDGQSAAAGKPSGAVAFTALALGLVALVAAAGTLAGGLGFALVAALLLALVFLAIRALALRQIDGYTGDILGGLEQVGEIALLLAAAALLA
ncbi:MAG: adenosylcobinamide-GDP ribazoletransferase [Rhodospirillales bacterium]